MNELAKIDRRGCLELELKSVSKSFGSKFALDDVTVSIPKGSLTVILGAAGAGKTTLLRTIAGLETPDSGELFIDGCDANGLEPKDRNIAMIFDNLALYPNKTGFENIANPLRIAKIDRESIKSQVRDIAGKLKIVHVLDRLPKTMSGGERQRVALGRAFVRKPSIFLLDEPLSSLDAMLRIELRTELRRLQRDLGYTFLLATPDFAEAMAIADNVVVIREGRVVQIADPQALYDAPVDWEVARFVGAPEINLLPAIFSKSEGGRISIEGEAFQSPPALRRNDCPDGSKFRVGIRPEHLRIAEPNQAQWLGEISDIEPLGLKAVVTVAAQNEIRILTAAVSTQHLRVGEQVGLQCDADKLLLFDERTKKRLF